MEHCRQVKKGGMWVELVASTVGGACRLSFIITQDLNTWTNFFNSHMNYSAYRHAVTQLDGAFCIPVM